MLLLQTASTPDLADVPPALPHPYAQVTLFPRYLDAYYYAVTTLTTVRGDAPSTRSRRLLRVPRIAYRNISTSASASACTSAQAPAH